MVREGLVWDNVTIVNDKKRGDPQVTCNLCSYKGYAGAPRLTHHFLCLKGNQVCICEPTTEENKHKLRALQVKLSAAVLQKDAAEAAAKKRKMAAAFAEGRTQTAITQFVNPAAKEAADSAVAEFFFACGLAFNVARSPYFTAMLQATAAAGTGYKPPGSEALRTTQSVKVSPMGPMGNCPCMHAT